MNQSLSFKLLSGLAVLLLVAAILPFFFGGKGGSETAATLDGTDSWPEASADKELPEADAPEAPSQPMTVLAAAPEQESPPEILPVDASPMMSSWPNASSAADSQVAANEKTPPVASRPMAVRPAEYQADARSGQAYRGQAADEKNTPNDNPDAGNRYDSTRPSVY